MGKGFERIALLSFIYFAPLLVESIDDFSKVRAVNRIQHMIDKWAVLLGILYLSILVGLVIFRYEGLSLLNYVPEAKRETVAVALKGAAIVTPGVFVLKKLYSLRISWCQNRNVADAYFNAPRKGK